MCMYIICIRNWWWFTLGSVLQVRSYGLHHSTDDESWHIEWNTCAVAWQLITSCIEFRFSHTDAPIAHYIPNERELSPWSLRPSYRVRSKLNLSTACEGMLIGPVLRFNLIQMPHLLSMLGKWGWIRSCARNAVVPGSGRAQRAKPDQDRLIPLATSSLSTWWRDLNAGVRICKLRSYREMCWLITMSRPDSTRKRLELNQVNDIKRDGPEQPMKWWHTNRRKYARRMLI